MAEIGSQGSMAPANDEQDQGQAWEASEDESGSSSDFEPPYLVHDSGTDTDATL